VTLQMPKTAEAGVSSLFGRVAPIPGESLLSFFARTANQNVCERLSGLLAHAGVVLKRPSSIPFVDAVQAERIAALCSVSPIEIEHLVHAAVTMEGVGDYVTWFGTRLERRFISTTTRRLSPRSLRGSPHHRAIWTVGPISFCPESFERLIGQCPYCEAKLDWRRTRGPAVCETCCRSLTRYHPGKVPWEYRRTGHLVASLLHHSAETRALALSKFPEPFQSWEPGDVFGAIVDLASFWDEANLSRPFGALARSAKTASSVSVQGLNRACNLLTSWPDSLECFIGELICLRADQPPSARSMLGGLGRYTWYPGKRTPMAELLRSEVPAILRRLSVPLYVNPTSRALSKKRDTLISNGDARTRLGIDNRILERLQPDGDAIVARREGRRGMILYDAAKLAASFQAFQTAVGEHQITRELGVPGYCISELARAGLMTGIVDQDALRMADGALLIERQSYEALLARLGELPICSLGMRSIESAMFGRLHPSDWANVLVAIRDHQLPATREHPEAKPWTQRIFVEEDSLADFLASCPSGPLPPLHVSATTAGRLLNVPNDFVPALVEKGFLEGTRDVRQMQICIRSIESFLENYATTREVSSRNGWTAPAISAAMRRKGYAPLASASKLKVWRRNELVGLLAESPKVKSAPV
jgi:TniQ